MGPRLDEILSRKASPVVYYYQDIQGSIRGLTGSDSKPIQAYEYTAFGERHVSSRSKQFLLLDRLIDQPYGFTGRPKEDLTGLYYYRYRDYNPQTGRFLQPDPLGQLPGPNIYSYCQNNPVNWVDPWGMEECRNSIYDGLNDEELLDKLKDANAQEAEDIIREYERREHGTVEKRLTEDVGLAIGVGAGIINEIAGIVTDLYDLANAYVQSETGESIPQHIQSDIQDSIYDTYQQAHDSILPNPLTNPGAYNNGPWIFK